MELEERGTRTSRRIECGQPEEATMIATVAENVCATAEELLAYLRQRLDVADLRYRQSLVAIPDGWETHTYRFQVESAEPVRRLPEFP